ncbi:uncharacterized protein BKA78DRAFT_109653 [Phyllosticta capitalensis]|uniref:uncharacterized protein n=1 Tax=Phyllosticta capitalensis TaxID=121624 RepID=UPI00312DD880
MRTSWPRTLRAKCTCRGTQCRSYSIGLARRMAASPAGRRALLFPTSTLLYSFMFGWGMLEDGHVKQQRREQWNQAIDQAKAELEEQKKAIDQKMGNLGADEKERLLKILDENAESNDDEEGVDAPQLGPPRPTLCNEMIIKWTQEKAKVRDILEKSAGEHAASADAEPAVGSQDSEQEAWEKAATDRWMSEQELELWKDSTMYTMLSRNKSTVPHNTGGDLDLENVPPQSIYASDELKRKGLKSRWTRRKIQATNLAMAKLVLRLIKEGVRKGDKGVHRTVEEKIRRLRNIPVHFHQIFYPNLTQLGRMELLITFQWYDTIWPPRERQDEIPRFPPVFHNKYPYYSQDPTGEFHLECYRMNHHIFNCFEQAFSGEISLQMLIMNICDSLLTSSAPPNVTTCNALILGFTRLEQPTLVDFVIQAFEETYIRFDEITCCAILNHYMRTERANHFSNLINMMTGAVQVVQRRYLFLAHPLLHQNWSNEKVARKTHNRVVPHPTQPGKLVQKVFPTPKVFSRIIVGNLKFYGLADTIELCTHLTQDGWAFDIAGLTYFLAATAAEADWAAGVMVWQQIQDLRASAPTAPISARGATSPFDAAGKPIRTSPTPLAPLDIEAYAHMLVLCDKCARPDVAAHVVAEAFATSGHRPIPIRRLATRLAKGGRDAMLMKSLRVDDHRLRADMGQQLAADWRAWRDVHTEGREAEAEQREEEAWLRRHAERVRRHGVARWWDEEGEGLEETSTHVVQEHNQLQEQDHHHHHHHLDTTAATKADSSSTPPSSAEAESEAIKAWEAEAWMSTKSRRLLYQNVRKVWSPQWEQEPEQPDGAAGTSSSGDGVGSAKGGGRGG